MKKKLLLFMVAIFSIGGLNSQVGLDFDGNDDVILTDYEGVVGSASRTIEVWFKKDFGSGQMIISESGGGAANFSRFTFKLQNNHLRVEIGGGLSLEGNTYLSSSTWYHGAVVYDDNAATNKYTLYLDGQIEAQGDFSGVNTTNIKTSIGARSNGVGAFNGMLDEYRFWTTARTQAEIQSNMNDELCTLPATLGAYFKFNEGVPAGANTAITNAVDEVSPSAVNTLTNFAMTGTFSNYVVGEVNVSVNVYETNVTSCGAYTWSENGITYTTSGTYDETFTASNGCDSTLRLILDIPVIDLNVTSLATSGGLIADQTGATYQWLDCNNGNSIIIGETAASFIATVDGSYAVEITSNGCVDTSACTPVIAATYLNPGLNFDGVDDYISTSTSGVSGNGARTVEAWIKVPIANTTSQNTLIDWGTFAIGQRSTFNILNQKLRFEVGGAGVNGTTLLNDDTWHHVAFTYDPNDNDTIRFYVDGVEDGKGRITSVNSGSSINIIIGDRTDYNSKFFGEMDDVRVFDFVRTESEISAEMNQELCSQTTGLIAYFNFNEGTPFVDNSAITTVADLSSNLGTGTLENFDLTISTSNFVIGAPILAGLTSTVEQVSACNDYTWAENSTLYNTSGIYSEVLTATSGCDSILILDLTIVQPDLTTITELACNTFTWAENGMTYTTSGQYSETYTNQAGCDSIITLDLTITTPTSSTSTETACDQFVWSANGTTLTTSGQYVETLTSQAGCDSIVTLDLTINQSDASTVTETACDQFTWSENGTTYTTSGQYVETYTNQLGCDSTITLDLTITLSDAITETESACDSFVWAVNGTTYTTSGQYVESFTNQAGCDSIITLDLTISSTDSIVLDEVACNEYTWNENGTTYTTSGQYVESFTNQGGCDSVMVLNLTINSIDLTVTNNNSGTFTANQDNATYQWIDCNTNDVIAGETSQDFTPTYNGSFAVIVDVNNCSDTSDCIAIGNVGLDQNDLNSFTLYPNPSNGAFNIEFNQSFTGMIKVYDATGKLVYEGSENNNKVSNIKLSNVENGIYFVKIISANGYASTKKVSIK